VLCGSVKAYLYGILFLGVFFVAIPSILPNNITLFPVKQGKYSQDSNHFRGVPMASRPTP
jgi:hypothetical protein